MNLEGIPQHQRQIRLDAVAKALEGCRGILHLGAHAGHEAVDYDKAGKPVVWFEALPTVYEGLVHHISKFSRQRAVRALLGDEDGRSVKFHVSNNWNGVSSSIFDFGPYGRGEKSLWPELNLKMVDVIELEMITLDSVLDMENIDSKSYDHWVVDVQGAELLVLRGAKKSIRHCNSLIVEVSQKPVYENGVLWPELSEYLESQGFVACWAPQKIHDDVLFVRGK